jgi:hypothetical protein
MRGIREMGIAFEFKSILARRDILTASAVPTLSEN